MPAVHSDSSGSVQPIPSTQIKLGRVGENRKHHSEAETNASSKDKSQLAIVAINIGLLTCTLVLNVIVAVQLITILTQSKFYKYILLVVNCIQHCNFFSFTLQFKLHTA
jgi:hypothetical protein